MYSTHPTLSAICQHPEAKILKTTKKRPKVIEIAGSEIVKVFYEKKSLSRFYKKPAGLRFVENARELEKRGFNAPKIIANWTEDKTIVVQYQKIPGTNLETVKNHTDSVLLFSFIRFIARLHAAGVFFRSFHLTNFLYDDDGKFSLIDIDEVTFSRASLPVIMRYRNLKHLLNYRKDKDYWRAMGMTTVIDYYLQHASLNAVKARLIKYLLT